MDEHARIQAFLDMIQGERPLFYWLYSGEGELLDSTCPAPKVLDTTLRKLGGMEAFCAAGEAPLIFGTEYTVTWIAVQQREAGKVVYIHVLGPFFANEAQPTDLNSLAEHIFLRTTTRWGRQLTRFLRELPAVSLPLYRKYALILCYLVTGQRLGQEALEYQVQRKEVPSDFSNLAARTPPKDRRQIYWAERALLNAVREGDVEGGSAMENISAVAKVRSYTSDPLLNIRIACTTFAALCTRAAIEGGLSATLSYGLGDAYIKSFFQARTASEVTDVKNQMYKDFILRVHAVRQNPKYSKMVQSSCDHIELHLAEPLSIELLAARLGYSKYYLSARFKKETGCTVGDYIKFARVERAKVLLATTDKSVESIAEATGFVNRSYFSNTFKRCTGKTPADYRRENRNA